jgi:hypothetical protein
LSPNTFAKWGTVVLLFEEAPGPEKWDQGAEYIGMHVLSLPGRGCAGSTAMMKRRIK